MSICARSGRLGLGVGGEGGRPRDLTRRGGSPWDWRKGKRLSGAGDAAQRAQRMNVGVEPTLVSPAAKFVRCREPTPAESSASRCRSIRREPRVGPWRGPPRSEREPALGRRSGANARAIHRPSGRLRACGTTPPPARGGHRRRRRHSDGVAISSAGAGTSSAKV